jgi:murein DD-endopeptidase MepM/ murein hydrolase activator NlpD
VVIAGDDSQTVYGPVANFYGNLIVLEHHFPGIDQPIFTLYGHLSKIDVSTGQAVQAGEVIGEVGATGAAIGSHLHFELREGQDDYDSNRNPVLWMKPLVGEDGNSLGVIAGQLLDAQGNPTYTNGINLQYFLDPNGPQSAAYPVETYAPEKHPVHGDDTWNENFAFGDLPAGRYRISLMWGGKLYERWLEVQPGKVTLVVLKLNDE